MNRQNFFLFLGLVTYLLLIPCIKNSSILLKSAFADDTNLITAIEKVSDQVGPTVVSIKTEVVEKTKGHPFMFGSPFHDEFFNRFFEDFFGELPESEQRIRGLGSGVIIDKKGYILTNEHVVGNADTLSVTLPDGREFDAILKGTDPRSDLAIIKIDAPDLPVATLGDSENLKIGQWVVAIGNPFGHLLTDSEPTVTTGVISALQRSLPKTSRRDTDYSDLIQTDAAINPGNSGGPLVNLNGEVIGINVAIFSTSGGYQGIGFAIPINHAKLIVEQLIQGKEIAYGWIGVSVQEVNQKIAEYFKLQKLEGVLISKVLEDGPAQKAGLKDGDIILAVNDKTIKNTSSLLKNIGTAEIGKEAKIKILRDGKELNIPVVVAKRPRFDEFGQMIEEDTPQEEKEQETVGSSWRGLTVTKISPEIAKQLGLDSKDGVVVSNIEDHSPAKNAGLRKGDVILSVNQKTIGSVDDFMKLVRKLKGNCLIKTPRGFFVLEES